MSDYTADYTAARSQMATAYLTKDPLRIALSRRDFEFLTLKRQIAKSMSRLESAPLTDHQVNELTQMLKAEM